MGISIQELGIPQLHDKLAARIEALQELASRDRARHDFGKRSMALSLTSRNRPHSEGPSVNLGFELLSFLPTKLPNDPRRDDDDPLGVLSAAEATAQLPLEFHTHRQLRRNTSTLLIL